MTQSIASEWRIHVPLIVEDPVRNRRTGKLVKRSPWLTLNDRDSWHRRKKLTTYYRAQGAALVGTIPFMQKAHVTYYISYGNNRRLDPHNYMLTAKAVIDGMVDAGLLVDDCSKYLIGPDPRRDESLPVGLTLQIVRLE